MTIAPALTGILLLIAMVVAAGYGRRRARAEPATRRPGAAHVSSTSSHDSAGASPYRIGVRLIASGAVLLSVPTAIAHGSADALAMGAQAAAMLLFVLTLRSWWRHGWVDRRAVAQGLAVGLILLAAASLSDAAGWIPKAVTEALGWTSFAGRASLWHAHPNILATMALLPVLAVMAWGDRTTRYVAAPAALALVTATGSRTALAVLLLIGLSLVIERLLMPGTRRRPSLRWAVAMATAGVLALLSGIFTTVFDRFDPRTALAPSRPPVNLLYASEDLLAGSWTRLGVSVRRVAPAAFLRGDREWVVEKTGTAWWSRVQQGVTIAPGAIVTLQVDVRQPDPAARPGLHARVDGPDGPAEVTLQRREGQWSVVAIRGVELRGWTASDDGPWTSLALTIANPARAPLPIALGLTPDQRPDTSGGSMWVRRPQAVIGAPAGYEPTRPSGVDSRSSLGTWQDRIVWARIGWDGFLERPWFGHGIGAFPDYAAAHTAARRGVAPDAVAPVTHAHQLLSQTAFERGAVGLVGLALLLAGFVLAGHRGHPAGWRTMTLVMLLNLTDFTFWTTPVSYTLGAITGLAGHRAPSNEAATTPGTRRGQDS